MDEQKLVNLFIDNAVLDGDKIILNSRLHEAVSTALHDYKFDVLKDIKAVDKGDGSFELIYHLYSMQNDEEILYSITVNEEAESVSDLFKSAIADECEIYDLFGIKFTGNDNLKRLYMPESWNGYPLRKDYIQDDTRLAWNDDNNV